MASGTFLEKKSFDLEKLIFCLDRKKQVTVLSLIFSLSFLLLVSFNPTRREICDCKRVLHKLLINNIHYKKGLNLRNSRSMRLIYDYGIVFGLNFILFKAKLIISL